MTANILDAAARETLRFAYGDTVLGTIVVAESVRGIAASSSATIAPSFCAI